MTTRKKNPPKESIHISSLSLTPATERILKRLSQDAGDYIGRSVSSSAIVRALSVYAGQQNPLWLREVLFPLIERELESGVRWGKKRER